LFDTAGVVGEIGLGGGEPVVAEDEPNVLESRALVVEHAGEGSSQVVRAEVRDPDAQAAVVHDGGEAVTADGLRQQSGRCRPRVDAFRESGGAHHGRINRQRAELVSDDGAPVDEFVDECTSEGNDRRLVTFPDEPELAAGEVDVAPAESADLAGAQSGEEPSNRITRSRRSLSRPVSVVATSRAI
jgi:hypothetical protein